MSLEIVPAVEADLPDVFSILDEASAFLQKIGVTEQWPTEFSTNPTWVKLLQQLVGSGTIFICREDQKPLGTFNLRESPNLGEIGDPSWDGINDSGLYLYLLAVRRSVAGQGVAKAMLEWAYALATQSTCHLRLDCWAGNSRLKQYYLEAGFEALGDVVIKSSLDGRRYGVSRFQRRC